MDRTVKKYLFDITTAINNIEEYIGYPKIFANYERNRQLQQAVERNLGFKVISRISARPIVDSDNPR